MREVTHPPTMKQHCYSRRSCYDGGRYWGVGVHETASVGAGLDIGSAAKLESCGGL